MLKFPKNNSKSPNVLHLANHRYKKSNKDKLTKEYVRKKRVGKENIDPLLMREATEYHDTKQSRRKHPVTGLQGRLSPHMPTSTLRHFEMGRWRHQHAWWTIPIIRQVSATSSSAIFSSGTAHRRMKGERGEAGDISENT
uniref:(California timema) hypothetical protein n=1 Tax=Timema californicum TaxID=61474 RepID=A0A7R9PAW2_TIMCA|nr:unnamed protein product [Timema californicum]